MVALKLKLTLVALGISPKDLCRRFSAVNSATSFTLQNAYKWLGGKSAPRMSQVYDEWARILGGDLTGSFIAAASFEEFATSLSAHHRVPTTTLAELMREASSTGQASSAFPLDGGTWSINQLLMGRYLALSLAWSQAQSGKLILGQVDISRNGTSGLKLTYSEALFGRIVIMDGAVICDGRTAQAMAVCRESGRCYLFALCVPSPPANLIGGVFSGSALHDFGARPCASRILFIRDHSAADASGRSRTTYLEPLGKLISRELADLGYGPEDERLDCAEHMKEFLLPEGGTGLLEATPDSVGALGLLLDRLSNTWTAPRGAQ
ncbi:hypothetical protein [Microvirga makkahensis]|uniref:Uncharacterized protein n=1 Tax=Microvirga makkahensis TaxID=1128670 RepID=A0A7X3MT19_9HYPH|nr:hypothetical protein [Microvirga makkahensis]MXQ12631.1 hypothetical protein [Microvirga makkahensis]